MIGISQSGESTDVIAVLNQAKQMGALTAGITKMSIGQVVRAALPWTMVLLAFLVIVTYVPAITLFLPNLLF